MEGKVTISLDKLDYYRGLETAMDSYKKKGVFKVDIQSDSYGSAIRTYYYASNESDFNKSLLKESNKIRLVNSELKRDIDTLKDKLYVSERDNLRLDTLSKFLRREKRPIDITRFEWSIIGYIIGMSVAGLMVYIWN